MNMCGTEKLVLIEKYIIVFGCYQHNAIRVKTSIYVGLSIEFFTIFYIN